MSEIVYRKLKDLKLLEGNPRQIGKAEFQTLCKSVADNPDYFEARPLILSDRTGELVTIAGNMRYRAAKHNKQKEVPTILLSGLTAEREAEIIIRDNVNNGSWDFDALANEWSDFPLDDWGLDLPGFEVFDEQNEKENPVTLADRFLIPPFSVLDARQGYWQDRKRAWLALGIQSELGRGESLIPLSESNHEYRTDKKAYFEKLNAASPGGSLRPAMQTENGKTVRGDGKGKKINPARCFGQDLMKGEHTLGAIPKNKNLTWVKGERNGDDLDDTSRKNLAAGRQSANSSINSVFSPTENAGDTQSQTGTSIFDPVLCELVYLWFSGKGARVLDPFAGGSVRGIVANYLDRDYTGVDLRAEQIAANETQAEQILPENKPRWICGNSIDALPDEKFDLIFSCPPYYNLEIYSEDAEDLSNRESYADFLRDYRCIVKQSISRLENDRFACFCVGDIRDKKGIYRNFVSDTITAFQDAGAKLYNEAILVTAVGSLPIRVGRQFDAGRKLGKTHQNVLIFVKGDARKATKFCGKVEIADLAEAFGEIA